MLHEPFTKNCQCPVVVVYTDGWWCFLTGDLAWAAYQGISLPQISQTQQSGPALSLSPDWVYSVPGTKEVMRGLWEMWRVTSPLLRLLSV